MLTDEQLRARLAEQQWTAHNLRLSDQVETLPGRPDMLATDSRLLAILRTLRILHRGRLAGLRVADLGCLEGGFTLAFAREGATVVGVEARQTNIEKAMLLREHFELENVDLLLDDVKAVTAERYGRFDVVLALGILYHLDDPVSWLAQIGALTDGVLVVESHYAPDEGADLTRLHPGITALGDVERWDAGGWTASGRWFFEYEAGIDPEPQVWASYSNSSSLWLTKESLLLAIKRAGFDVVLEQYDYTADLYEHFTTRFMRGLFVALKSSAFDGVAAPGRDDEG